MLMTGAASGFLCPAELRGVEKELRSHKKTLRKYGRVESSHALDLNKARRHVRWEDAATFERVTLPWFETSGGSKFGGAIFLPGEGLLV